MAYSLDYRQRVMKIKKEENLTYEETGKRFGIGIRTLFRWKHRLQPHKTRNKPATKIDMSDLAKDIQKHPDDYLFERAQKFNVHVSTIHYAMKRLGVTYKKNSHAPQSGRKGTYKIPKKN